MLLNAHPPALIIIIVKSEHGQLLEELKNTYESDETNA